MIKLATWNVNSLTIRLQQVLDWFFLHEVDVLALQETKVTDEAFPLEVFRQAGLYVAFSGQKSYNGVAVISRYPLQDVQTDIAGLLDPQRRILAVTVADIRVVNLYVPNGACVDSDKYAYKLDWLYHVHNYLRVTFSQYPKLAVVGDFNIAPHDKDVYDPLAFEGSVLVSPRERHAFQELLNLGFADAFRHVYPDEVLFSWWDYRKGAFRRNHGLRIDHVLLSPLLTMVCQNVRIDRVPRQHARPSDHAPVLVEMVIDLP